MTFHFPIARGNCKYLLFCCIFLSLASLLPAGQTTLINGDFEMGEKGWTLSKSAHFDAFSGHDGTTALLLQSPEKHSTIPQRDKVKQQTVAATASQIFSVQPGRLLQLELWCLAEKLQGSPATVTLQFYQKKLSRPLPAYTKSFTLPLNTQEWTRQTFDFNPPAKATHAQLTLALPAETTGTLRIDKISLKTATYPFALALLPSPYPETIDPNHPTLRIAIAHPGASDLAGELVSKTLRIYWDGHQALRAAAPIVEFPLETKLTGDTLPVTIELIDHDTQRVLASLRSNLCISPEQENLIGTYVNHLKQIIYNNTVKLPIGIVGLPDTTTLDQLVGTPLQCLLPLDNSLPATTSPGIVQKWLDDCHARNLHLLLPVGKVLENYIADQTSANHSAKNWDLILENLIEQFATHPALLTWSLTANGGFSREAHGHFKRQDKDHPVCLLLDGHRVPEAYLQDADVFCATFSLSSADDTQNAVEVSDVLAQTEVASAALASLPLPFLAIAHLPVNEELTLEEMRAFVLLLAIRGARGFFFDATPTDNSAAIAPELQSEHLQKLCSLATTLEELSPYLLSPFPSQTPSLTIQKGLAVSREFLTPSGKRLLLVVGGLHRGKTKALLTPPRGTTFVSRFGNAKPSGKGAWLFQTSGLAADILEIVPSSK